MADIVEGPGAFVQVTDLDCRWMAINKAGADEIYGKQPRPGASMLDLLADLSEHVAALSVALHHR